MARDNRRSPRKDKERPSSQQPQDKSWIVDLSEQGLDTFIGPVVRTAIAKLPDSLFQNPASRQFLRWIPIFAHGLSLFIARITRSDLLDAFRTRTTAALTDSIEARLRGETLSAAVPGQAPKIGAAIDGYITNFFAFLARMPETEWASWLNGLGELDDSKITRVGFLFSGMNERQLDKIIQAIQSGRTPVHDWGLFFKIMDKAGFLGGDALSGASSASKTDAFIKHWFGICGELNPDEISAIVGFLSWVSDSVSQAAQERCKIIFLSWSAGDFRKFAALKDNEERLLLLLGEKPRSSDDKSRGVISQLGGVFSSYRKRQEQKRKQLQRAIADQKRRIAKLRKELGLEVH